MLISPTGFKYWVPALAEALGVMMYTFLACAAVVASPLASAQSADAASGTSNDCCVGSRSYLLIVRVGADVVAIAIAHGVAYAICVAATLNLRSGVTVIDLQAQASLPHFLAVVDTSTQRQPLPCSCAAALSLARLSSTWLPSSLALLWERLCFVYVLSIAVMRTLTILSRGT